jgi:hypothetical protein
VYGVRPAMPRDDYCQAAALLEGGLGRPTAWRGGRREGRGGDEKLVMFDGRGITGGLGGGMGKVRGWAVEGPRDWRGRQLNVAGGI